MRSVRRAHVRYKWEQIFLVPTIEVGMNAVVIHELRYGFPRRTEGTRNFMRSVRRAHGGLNFDAILRANVRTALATCQGAS